MATYEGQDIIIDDDRSKPEPALLAGDSVTVYGVANGTATIQRKQKTYQGGLAFGFTYDKTVDTYENPRISVKYVDF